MDFALILIGRFSPKGKPTPFPESCDEAHVENECEGSCRDRQGREAYRASAWLPGTQRMGVHAADPCTGGERVRGTDGRGSRNSQRGPHLNLEDNRKAPATAAAGLVRGALSGGAWSDAGASRATGGAGAAAGGRGGGDAPDGGAVRRDLDAERGGRRRGRRWARRR